MNARLDRFLRGIEDVPTQVGQAVDRGLNSFHLSEVVITDWKEFSTLMVRFHAHIEGAILGLSAPRVPDEWKDIGECGRLLRKEFGVDSLQDAFDMARDGTGGGLPYDIRILACAHGEYYAREHIAVAVSQYWNARSTEQLVADAREYVQRYGDLLPPGMIDGDLPRVLPDYRRVLKQHPLQIRAIRAATGRATSF